MDVQLDSNGTVTKSAPTKVVHRIRVLCFQPSSNRMLFLVRRAAICRERRRVACWLHGRRVSRRDGALPRARCGCDGGEETSTSSSSRHRAPSRPEESQG
eukprot:2228492-Pleurochrysis_carterae.AAC.1